MRKLIFILLAFMLTISTAHGASTLYGYYAERGQNLPSIADREEIALEADISPYTGSYNQNVALLDYLQDDFSELQLGATIPVVIGFFETSLASKITSSQTTMTLTRGTDDDGTTLSGTFGFVIDEGSSSEEVVVATCAGTACTGLQRGLSVLDGKTEVAANKKSHRRGASVKMTNYPILAIISRIMNGDESFPNALTFDGKLTYSSAPTFSSDLDIISKQYADNQVNQGAATSTPTVAGISELATQNEMASSTPWGITEPHVIQSQYATSTPSGGTSAAKYVVVSEADGKINQLWLDLTEGYTFSGNVGLLKQVDIPGALGNVYSNYLGGSFNIGYSATSLENATGTLNVLGDTFMTGNATTTGDLDIGGDINGSSINNNYYSTASDNLKVSEDSEDTTTSGTFALLKTIRINTTGGARVKYDIKTDSNAITSQLWKNGTYVGSGQYDGSDTSFVTQSIDLTFLHTGDVLQVYAKHGGAGATITAKNFRVYFDTNDLGQYGVGLD